MELFEAAAIVQIAVAMAGGCTSVGYQTFVKVRFVACIIRSGDHSAVVAGKAMLTQITSRRLSNFDIVLCVASLLCQIFLVQ